MQQDFDKTTQDRSGWDEGPRGTCLPLWTQTEPEDLLLGPPTFLPLEFLPEKVKERRCPFPPLSFTVFTPRARSFWLHFYFPVLWVHSFTRLVAQKIGCDPSFSPAPTSRLSWMVSGEQGRDPIGEHKKRDRLQHYTIVLDNDYHFFTTETMRDKRAQLQR